MTLDDLEQKHKEEYEVLFNYLQQMKNNTSLSIEDFDKARCYRIDILASLISELEKKANEQ